MLGSWRQFNQTSFLRQLHDAQQSLNIKMLRRQENKTIVAQNAFGRQDWILQARNYFCNDIDLKMY